MKAKQLLFSFMAAATIFGLVACNDGDSSGTGQLTVKMTDAPFPTDLVSEANVTITKIEARQKGGDNGGNPFVIIMETEVSANLLDLTNGVTENLASVEIPAGSYDLVRVYVSDASVTLKDGTTFDLKVPSGSQSGIKVFIKPAIEVAGGLTSELLLDFDVASSFKAQGNISTPAGVSGFIFSPVIKASNESFAGRLTGKVTAEVDGEAVGVEGAQVSVYAADTLNTTTFAEPDGSYTVLGLHAGMYDLVIEADGYEASSVDDVEIVAANATTTDVELTAIE